jgi:GTP-binding protein HflX
MTNASVDAEDKLFATLDPTSRRLRFPEEREIILTDTVGFIRNLPKDLVHAFRSTLDEAVEAELLLHVMNSSDPEIDTQKLAVEKVLKDLGAEETPTILVLNQIDRADADQVSKRVEEWDAVAVSALTGEGIERLLERIERYLFREQAARRWESGYEEPAADEDEVSEFAGEKPSEEYDLE